MSKFTDSLMTKSASEAAEALAERYVEVQAARRSGHVKSAMSEEVRRALIGAAAGAGIGGLGSLGAGYVKNKKLRMSDALYGALVGAVPGAAIGAYSAPAASTGSGDKTDSSPPKAKGWLSYFNPNPLALFTPGRLVGHNDPVIDKQREEQGSAPQAPPLVFDDSGGYLLPAVGATGLGATGAAIGKRAVPGVLDKTLGFKPLDASHAPADVRAILNKQPKKWTEAERMLHNKWVNSGEERLLGIPGVTKNKFRSAGKWGGGLLGLWLGANTGAGLGEMSGTANDYLNSLGKEPQK